MSQRTDDIIAGVTPISDIDWASLDVAEQEIIGNWLISSGDFAITPLPPGYVAPVVKVEKIKDNKKGKIVGYLVKAAVVIAFIACAVAVYTQFF
mgnify:CR=1 FL=1